MRQRPLNLRLLLGGERCVSQQLGGSDQRGMVVQVQAVQGLAVGLSHVGLQIHNRIEHIQALQLVVAVLQQGQDRNLLLHLGRESGEGASHQGHGRGHQTG